MSRFAQLIIFLTTFTAIQCAAPLVAPYVDILIPEQPTLKEIAEASGLRGFTVAFVLARTKGECKPMWGGQAPIDYEEFITQIRDFQAIGGQVIVSTGGAAAPYLEAACNTPQELAAAYELILDTVRTNDLDIDIEGAFNFDIMNEALAIVQKKRANFTISFTVITQGDDYGITDQLGTAVLKNAVQHGVRVDLVNPMTMEFDSLRPSYGDAVIQVGLSTIEQMRKVWPEKTTAQLRKMLGNTPMIGKNNNGKTYTPEHARQLVKWANNHEIGRLGFWSVGRDNGKCPNGWVDSGCSSIQQQLFEFSKIFAGFNGIATEPIVDEPTPTTRNPSQSSTSGNGSPVTGPTTTTTPTKSVITHAPLPPPDCLHTNIQFFPHDTDCHKYYHCTTGVAVVEVCPANTIWDIDISSCNWITEVKGRPECGIP